jgi:hypothetical protein
MLRLFPVISFLAFLLCAAAGRGNAAATESGPGPFQGAIDISLAMEAARGELRLSMAGERARLDMSLSMDPLPAPMRMAVLIDAKRPRKAVLLNDALKVYSEIDLADIPAAPDSSEGRYAVKELGKEKLLGYTCTHITLKRTGELVDAWITPELPEVSRVLDKIRRANPQFGAEQAFRTLEAAGKGGLPMRCIVVRDGQRVTTEVRKIERRAVPESLFEVPAGYAKSDIAAGSRAAPEQSERLNKMIEGSAQGR